MRPAIAYVQSDDTPPTLAQLAAAQHGVVATWQLLALGQHHTTIQRIYRRGWLHRVHRGVYAVGHPRLTLKGRWMAATLACGPEAVLSHDHAAALRGLRRAPYAPVHVTGPALRQVDGVRCHVCRGMRGRPRVVVDAIPVASIERIMLDMAVELGPQPLRSLLESAQRAGLFDHQRVQYVIAHGDGHHGTRPLRAAVASLMDEAPSLWSSLEMVFLELVRRGGLPEPSVNVIVAGELIDCSWPEHNLVAEVDSWRYHSLRGAFEEDRRRGNKLGLAHVTVLRFTDRRIANDPDGVLTELRQGLGL